MGKPRTGTIRPILLKDGTTTYEIWVAGEYLGRKRDPKIAERVKRAALRDDEGKTPRAFSVFASKWMDEREIEARRRKRSNSFKKERSVWRAHVESAPFWVRPIAKIDPQHIQDWLDDLKHKEAMQVVRRGSGHELRPTGRTVGRRVLENSLKLVKLCFDAAVLTRDQPVKSNPARLAKLPREEPKEHDGELVIHLSEEQIADLFALPLPPLQRAVFAVAIYVGLRLDELWGLRWMDVVLDGPRPLVRVRRSYAGPVKTKFALRDPPLLPPAVAALRAWRDVQPAAPIGEALVFPGVDGGCHGESYTAGWRGKSERRGGTEVHVVAGWRDRAGVQAEVDFKDLRHTCGCHLAMGTWTPPLTLLQIKRWLGHSTIAVTERHYVALTSDSLHDAIGRHRGQKLPRL